MHDDYRPGLCRIEGFDFAISSQRVRLSDVVWLPIKEQDPRSEL